MELPSVFVADHAQGLVTLLRHSLSGQHQAAAARLLEQAEAVPGFASLLLTILRSSSEESIRLMAMICIRNTVRRHWSEGRNSSARLAGVVPPEERALIRSALLELVVSEPSMKICSQAIAAVARICRVNWPSEWPEAFTTMIGALNNCWPSTLASFSVPSSLDASKVDEGSLRPLARIVLLLHRVTKELSTKTLAHDRKRYTLLAGDILPQLIPLWQAAKGKLVSELAAVFSAYLNPASPSSSSAPFSASSSLLLAQLKSLVPLSDLCLVLVKLTGRLLNALPHVGLLLPPARAMVESLIQLVHEIQECRNANHLFTETMRKQDPPELGYEMPAPSLVPRLWASDKITSEDGFVHWSTESNVALFDAEDEDDPAWGLAKIPGGQVLNRLQRKAINTLQDLTKAHLLAMAAGGHIKAMSEIFLRWVTASVSSSSTASDSASGGGERGTSPLARPGATAPAVTPRPVKPFPPPEVMAFAVAILTHILDCSQKLLPYQHFLLSPSPSHASSSSSRSPIRGGAGGEEDFSALENVLSELEEPNRLFSGFTGGRSSAPPSARSSTSGVSSLGSNSPIAGFGAATPDFPPLTPAQHESCMLSKLGTIDSPAYRRSGAAQLLECHGVAFSPASHDGWLQFCVQNCLTLCRDDALSWSADSAEAILNSEKMARESSGLRGAGEALLLALVSDETHAVAVCSKLFAYAHSLTDTLLNSAASKAANGSFSFLLVGATSPSTEQRSGEGADQGAAARTTTENDAALLFMQAETRRQLLQLEAAHQAAGLAAADAVARGVLSEEAFESWFASRLLPLLAVCGLAPELCKAAAVSPPQHLATPLVALELSKGGPLSLESCFILPSLNPTLCSMMIRRIVWMVNCCRSVLSQGIRTTLVHLCVALMTRDVFPSSPANNAEALGAIGTIFGVINASNAQRIAHLASGARRMTVSRGLCFAAATFLHALIEDSAYNAPPLCRDASTVANICAASYMAAGALKETDEVEPQLQCVAVVTSLLEKCSPTTILAVAKGASGASVDGGKPPSSPVGSSFSAPDSSFPSLLSFMPGVWNGMAGDVTGRLPDDDDKYSSYVPSMLRRHVLKTLHTVFSALPFAAILANLQPSAASSSPVAASSPSAAALATVSLAPELFSVCIPLISHSLDVRSPDEVYLCKDALELLACILEVAPDAALQEPSFYSLVPTLPLLVARDPEHTTLVAEVTNAFLLRAGAVMLASPGAAVSSPTNASGASLIPLNPSAGIFTTHPGCGPAFSQLLSSLLQYSPGRSTGFVYAALDNAVLAAVNNGCAATSINSVLGAPATQLLLSLIQGNSLRKAAAKDEEEEEAAAAASRKRKEERLAAAFNKGKSGSGSSGFAPSSVTDTSGLTSLSSVGGTLSSQSTPSGLASAAIGVASGDSENDSSAKRMREAILAASASVSSPTASSVSSTSSSSAVPAPQMDGDLQSHGATVLARMFLASEEATLALLSSTATTYAALLGACGVFSADLAQIASLAPTAFPVAGALRLLVWLLDVWLDSFEDVSFGSAPSSSSTSGDGASGGTSSSSSSAFHTTPHAVAMLWRNKLLTLASLSALRTVLRLYVDLSASTAAAVGPAAARFLEEVNVLRPDSGIIDAITALASDAATAAEALQSAATAVSSGMAGGAGPLSGAGVATSAPSGQSQTARPGVLVCATCNESSSNNNAGRALAAAAMHIPGLHDTPSRRRARAKARKHLQATLLGSAPAGSGTLIDADAVAAGIEVSAGDDDDDYVELAPPGVGLAKALLSLTHARSMSDGSGFRVRVNGGPRSGSGDADDMDAPEPEDDDGFGEGFGEGDNYYGSGGGSGEDAGDEIDALLSGVTTTASGPGGTQQTLSDSAAARYRLLNGKAEINADVRSVTEAAFATLQTALPPDVWRSSVLSRVSPGLQRR